MSYSNLDNVPAKTAGVSPVLASDWNTYVKDNFDSLKQGHLVVANDAAKTALGSVAAGTMVFQTDKKAFFVYTGSAWVLFNQMPDAALVPAQDTYTVVAYKEDQTTQVTFGGSAISFSEVKRDGAFFSVTGGIRLDGAPSSNFTELWVNLPYLNRAWIDPTDGLFFADMTIQDIYWPNFRGYVFDNSTGSVYDLHLKTKSGTLSALGADYYKLGYRSSVSAISDLQYNVPFTFATGDVIAWSYVCHERVWGL